VGAAATLGLLATFVRTAVVNGLALKQGDERRLGDH
jgi:hypothetical protein